MTIGPRKIVALVAAVVCLAVLVVSYAVVGVAGPLVIVGVLQVAAILAILEGRVALKRHVDITAARLDQRSSKIERRLTAHTERLKRERQRMGERRKREQQDLARRLEADRKKVERGVRRARREIEAHTATTVGAHYQQLEALLALYNDIRPTEAFPPLRRWAASPDLLHYAYRRIVMDRPSEVLELGSGVSTVVMAYALQKAGQGRVVALEQSEQYRDVTSALLARHGLHDRVDLRLAKLEPIELEGESYLWYATEALPEGPVDFVFVDGPPGNTQPQARYPALPLVHPRLSDRATVILDDCERDDESRIASRWAQRFPDLMRHDLRHEKGTLVFERA